ncbi:MAG: DUF3791 domain-containing protein [Clostridia bacterium]|nr:DUF3791 domain-containing protein [Clostridia bacterium]
MKANPVLLQMKYARIVKEYAKRTGKTIEEALDDFYHSSSYVLIKEGVADLHCMSESYLAEMLEDEMKLSTEERNRRLEAVEETGRMAI